MPKPPCMPMTAHRRRSRSSPPAPSLLASTIWGPTAAVALNGARADSNGVLVSASEDGGPVAIGFRAARSNGKHQYLWLYGVKFAVPKTPLLTKAHKIEFDTLKPRAPSCAATSLTLPASTRGRPKSPEAAQRPHPAPPAASTTSAARKPDAAASTSTGSGSRV